MKVLEVRHTTVYRYARPVTFGEHRLMFRPRDSHDLRLLKTELTIAPAAAVRWLHDVFGNSIAVASFAAPAAELRFESRFRLEHYPLEQPAFPIADYARSYPFSYSAEEVPDLVRTMERHYPDPEHRVDAWARQFVQDGDGLPDTQALLAAMTRTIRDTLTYTVRHEEGTQDPVETLRTGAGSCRDYALLMMEAVRSLGFAARFVTGYLYDPARDDPAQEGAVQGGGATHAWVQVYLPGAGWVEYDPTNGIVGGGNLIRVGVARDPKQAVPLAGSWTGAPADYLGMTVDVAVGAVAPGS